MQNFRQWWQPVVKAYNRFLFDPYMVDLVQFKGGKSVGTDWVSRHFQTYTQHVHDKYAGLVRRFKGVCLWDLIEDNWFRLVLLNGLREGVDRVVSLRQAHNVLNTKFFKPDSNSFAFTEVTEGGLLFKGWLRGSIANILQFSSTIYPALYFASEMGQNGAGSFLNFSWLYLALDAVMYPLDTIKTIRYVDSDNVFGGMRSLTAQTNFRQMYQGVFYKLLANIPWLWTVKTTVDDSSTAQKALSWAVLALTYPLNVLKTRSQLWSTQLSHVTVPNSSFYLGLYKGLVPYLVVNAVAQTVLYHFTGQHKREAYYKCYEEQVNYYNQQAHFSVSDFF